MKPDELFHRVRYQTADEMRESRKKYTRSGKLRKAYRKKKRDKNTKVYQGGAPGLKQQRR